MIDGLTNSNICLKLVLCVVDDMAAVVSTSALPTIPSSLTVEERVGSGDKDNDANASMVVSALLLLLLISILDAKNVFYVVM